MNKKQIRKPMIFLLTGIIVSSQFLPYQNILAQTKAEISPMDTSQIDERLQITSIVPGYSKLSITFTPIEADETYDIYRSNAVDGIFVKIGSTSSNTYTDSIGANVIRYYQIRSKDGLSISNIMSNGQKTGIQAMKDSAVLFSDVSSTTFDGQTMLDVSDKAANVNQLRAGTIAFRFRTNVANQNLAVLMGKTQGESVGITGAANKASVLLTNGNVRADFKHTRATALAGFADGEWHTAAIINDVTSTKAFRFTIDGKEIASFDAGNNDANLGFLSTVNNLNQLTIGGYQNGNSSAVLNGFQGEIEYVMISADTLTSAEASAYTNEENGIVCDIATSMFDASNENTWVFTGGKDSAGGYEETEGIRNYTGQFEEYIRWTMSGNIVSGKQRYVINTAKAGNGVKAVEQNFDTLVSQYDPKALAILVSDEDMEQGEEGINAFQAQLHDLILKALDLRDHTGYIVIQTPYARNDEQNNALSGQYRDAVRKVYNELDVTEKAKVAIVDHYALTNTATFKETCLEEDRLNALGHLEIAKQFTKTVYGSVSNFPVRAENLQKQKVDSPSHYLDLYPNVSISTDKMVLTLPEELFTYAYDWSYTLHIDQQVIQGDFEDGIAQVPHSGSSKEYKLWIHSKDGVYASIPVYGVLSTGHQPQTTPLHEVEKTTHQQKIQDLLETQAQVQWLFVGDSITHGALHTIGYDSIHQTFEKYLRNTMGRADDVVMNTASSGATTAEQEAYSYQRLDKYPANVVIVMLGTNDASGAVSITDYRKNLERIVDKIHAKGAIAVLRTPNPLRSDDARAKNLKHYAQVIREVAAQKDVMLVDHFADWSQALQNRAYLWENGYWNNDAIHPNANGQLNMTQALIRDLGIADETSALYHLAYEMPHTTEHSSIKTNANADKQSIVFETEKLAKQYGKPFGNVRVIAEHDGIRYRVDGSGNDTEVTIKDLPSNRSYTVYVEADLKDTAKSVTFDKETVYIDPAFQMALHFQPYSLVNLAPGNIVGKLSIESDKPQTPSYTLVDGEGSDDNAYFNITEDNVIIDQPLTANRVYQIRVRAEAFGIFDERIINIDTTMKERITAKILDKAIEKTELYIQEGALHNIAPDVAVHIRAALANAKTIAQRVDASDDVYLEAWLSLANALHYLDFKADKTALLDLINVCKAIDTSDFNVGVDAFLSALEKAEEVYQNANALQASIDEVFGQLQIAKSALAYQGTVDIELIQQQLEIIQKQIGDGEAYCKNAAWTAFIDAMDKLKQLCMDPEVDINVLHTAFLQFSNAYENIRLLPDEALLAPLRSFVQQIERMNVANYGDDEIAEVMAVKNRALSILTDLDHFEMSEYNQVMDAIQQALEIINKSHDKVVNVPIENVVKQSAHTQSQLETSKKKVATNDATSFAKFGVTILLAGCILHIIQKKNK